MFGLPSLPVIGIAIALGAAGIGFTYLTGYKAGGRACELRVERAVSAEQARQRSATDAALEDARKQDEARQTEIDELEKKVSDYEATLDKRTVCALTPADIERLSKLR